VEAALASLRVPGRQGNGAQTTSHLLLRAESDCRADGPTEVLLLCHQGKSAALGLSQNARFLLVQQPPQPLPGEARLRRHSVLPHCIAGVHHPPQISRPLQISPSRLGWQGSQTSLRNAPGGGAGVGAELKAGQRGDQCRPWHGEGQPRCPCMGRHLCGACRRLGTRVHPRERDRARQLWLHPPQLAPAVEHLARSARPSRHGKRPQPRKWVQKRLGFD